MSFTWWIYPTRRFTVAGQRCVVAAWARTDGLYSRLTVNGAAVAEDRTPIGGADACRNHRLAARIADGISLDVELGYVGVWTTGVIARVNGDITYESHPGKPVCYPEAYRARAMAMDDRPIGAQMKDAWREGFAETRPEGGTENLGPLAKGNRLPFAVDVATGLLFFVIAKLTDLTTAALIMAAVGIALVIFQRITRIDVTGGLVLFGIVMLLISAGLALLLQDEQWVKLRGTITGLIASTLFLFDGLFGGKRLATRLMRFMPYDDIDAGRFGIGMGVVGAIIAGLNYVVATYASTDTWLFYTTFADMPVAVVLFLLMMRYARTGQQTAAGLRRS